MSKYPDSKNCQLLQPSGVLLIFIIIATASPELDEFLDFIGQRVRMKGFDGYRAQLDNKSEEKLVYVYQYDHMTSHDPTADTTGEHSIYTEYNNCEIMFHVSTLLPYQDNHKQQVFVFH